MNKIVFGLIGPLASGKGTVAQYLRERHNAGSARFSSILRDILDRVYLPQTRENLQALSSSLRGQFGDDLLALAVAKDVERDEHDIVAVDGVRREPDIKHLKELPNFYLVSIDADIKIRHERMTKRGENPDDTTKTFEQFVADNKREAETQIAELQKKASFSLDNNGSLEDLHRQIDDLVSKVRAKI